MYSEAGTLLTVTDIDIIDQSSAPTRSHVLLSQEFLAPADFTIEGSIAWDSGGNNSAMQSMFIRLRSGGEIIVSAGYHDSAPAYRGEKSAIIGGAFFYSGLNSLPLSGSANIRIERIADEVSIFWDDALILNAVENRAIDEVAVIFRKSTYYSRGTFGELAIDYIWANSEKVQLTDLRIVGPNEVAEESVTQYTAIAVYDNNSTKDVTNEAVWVVMPDDYADINDSGLLNTYELVMPTEDVTIYAQYAEGNDIVQAEKDVQIFALCPQGSALEFDGEDDYIRAIETITVQSGLTLAAWVNYSGDSFGIISSYNAGDFPNSSYGLDISGNWCGEPPKRLVLLVGTGQAGDRRVLVSDVGIPENQWHHVAATWQPGSMHLYIDGVQHDGSLFGPNCSSSVAPTTINPQTSPVLIGAEYRGADWTTYRYINGKVDEVAVFDRSLPAEEIADLMRFGVTIDSNLIAYWTFDEGDGQVAHDLSSHNNSACLGSDPCNADAADPYWVEPGAPVHCTPQQMIVRNLNGALEDKAVAAERIKSALEKERASAKLLTDEIKEQKNRCRKPWIMWPVIEIKKSMLFEEQCNQKLQASIETLERALQWLLNDAVPDWPKKPDKPSPPKCNKR